MFNIKNILLPTDFSNTSLSAADYAVELAVKYGAKIHLLHVLEKTPPILAIRSLDLSQEKIIKSFEEEGKKQLENAAKKIKKGKTGINKLQNELSKRGIDKKVIQDVLSEVDSENYLISLKELAKKKLDQLKKKEVDKRKLSSKLASHLASKGYEFDLIYKIIRELDLDNEE